MATDRISKFNALPDKLKEVNAAIVEMNKVITGAEGSTGFDESQIWGGAAQDDITAYMEGLTVNSDLKNTVNALLGGLPGSSGVSQAIQTAIDGLQEVIRKIQDTAGDIIAEGTDRVGAFHRLNNPHPAGDYTPSSTEGFGFIPAIEGVINAAADTNVDVDDILGPLKTVAGIVAGAAGIADFTEFAVASVELLKKALTVS